MQSNSDTPPDWVRSQHTPGDLAANLSHMIQAFITRDSDAICIYLYHIPVVCLTDSIFLREVHLKMVTVEFAKRDGQRKTAMLQGRIVLCACICRRAIAEVVIHPRFMTWSTDDVSSNGHYCAPLEDCARSLDGNS